MEEPVDLASGLGVAEERQAERSLGDEHVARHRYEAGAGRIGPALIVAGDHDPLALVLHDDLGRAEHVTRRNEANVDIPDAQALVISNRLAVLGTVAHFHDRQRFWSPEHGAMPAARMIAVTVRDPRPLLRL